MRSSLIVAGLCATELARAEPAQGIVLGADEVGVDVTAEVFLAPAQVGRPLSIAYDFWWGVTARWTIGVIHSSRSLARIDAGAGVCLARGLEDCERRYAAAGFDIRYAARTDGALAIAPRARLLVRDVDPWKPAITIGALGRWHRGVIWLASDPYLRLGLANRDRGNRAAVVLPAWIGLTAGSRVDLALHTGIDGELATWRDGWHIPVGLVAAVHVPAGLRLTVEAGFSSLLGPQNDQKHRTVMLTLGWRTGDALDY